MPYATNNGARIYWEEHGAGAPVLMIMGLSFSLDMWYRTTPLIAQTHRALLLDNRGVGRSDVPSGPYSIRTMAEDARAVLDAAGVESAHIIGASMGGMIAQELALLHPRRVRSLLLACTSCGGLRSKLPDLRRFRERAKWDGRTPEERILGWNPLLYADSTPAGRIDEDTVVRLRWYPTARGYLSQLSAVVRWSSYSRLRRIQVPTLIVHGDSDLLIPPKNAEILARRIPGARMRIIPDAGHIFTTDQPGAASGLLIEFLERVREIELAALS
jgi:3-oxoadipate enol-lactonase